MFQEYYIQNLLGCSVVASKEVQIMENQLECLGDRKGHDSQFGHLAKKFLKKNINPSQSHRGYLLYTVSQFGCHY